jgi:hypothetical protein
MNLSPSPTLFSLKKGIVLTIKTFSQGQALTNKQGQDCRDCKTPNCPVFSDLPIGLFFADQSPFIAS